VAITPNGQTLSLVPLRNTTFAIEGRSGESVEFTLLGITMHFSDSDVAGRKKR
jgi:hypothetical protein